MKSWMITRLYKFSALGLTRIDWDIVVLGGGSGLNTT